MSKQTRPPHSEKKHRSLISNISDVIAIIGEDGTIKYKSPNITKHFGWLPEDLVGKEAWITLDPEDLEYIQREFHQLLQHENQIKTLEYKYICKDGSTVPIELTAINLVHDPLINGILCNYKSITERKQLEEERAKASKLESVGVLAGGIAHDFNNILTAILGNLSLAKIFADEDLNKAKKILAEAEKATLSAKDLTQQLLTFSKGGEPVTKTIRINGLIADTVRFALRGSNVKCDLQLGEVLWPVDADEGQIKQVINNIAINACQAMPKGGVISIKTANVTVRSEDSLPLPAGNFIKITIRDQGIGIPEDYLSKVFDPYFTTKQKGNGLGLATCYSIAKKHSGHIAVESEIGIGTAFHIYLPAASKEIEKREEVKKEASIIVGGKVLVMDDESALIDTVSAVLEYMGCDMESAPDGAEAVKLYKRAMKSDKPFDAVILDLTVPGGMGGQETVEKLLKIDPEVKAIVSSGYSNDPIMANFKEYGFSGVVSKPYQIEELRNVLHEVMKKEKNG